MTNISFLPPLLLMFGLLTIHLLGLYFLRKNGRKKIRRTPLAQNFLRSPGQSLESKIDWLNQEISLYFVMLVSLPLFFYSGFLSTFYVGRRQYDPQDVALWLICGFVFSFIFLLLTLKHLKKRRKLRLGYEGAVAVGQELNQLMLQGNHVYHDFPADQSTIDHVVLGPSGIFVVQTATRSKTSPNGRREDETVEYNGKILMFPDGDDLTTIEQAEGQSAWLSHWISRAVEDPIATRAIVALPGWFVKRTSADGISVVNPKQFSSLFKHIKPRPLADDMIARIGQQMEQKYREFRPGF